MGWDANGELRERGGEGWKAGQQGRGRPGVLEAAATEPGYPRAVTVGNRPARSHAAVPSTGLAKYFRNPPFPFHSPPHSAASESGPAQSPPRDRPGPDPLRTHPPVLPPPAAERGRDPALPLPQEEPGPGEGPTGPAPPPPGNPVPRDIPHPAPRGERPLGDRTPATSPPRRMEMGDTSRNRAEPGNRPPLSAGPPRRCETRLLASNYSEQSPVCAGARLLCWGQVAIPGEKRFGVLLPNLHETKGVNYHCLHPARREGRSCDANGPPLHNSLSSNTSPPALLAELRCREKQLRRHH